MNPFLGWLLPVCVPCTHSVFGTAGGALGTPTAGDRELEFGLVLGECARNNK